MKSRSNLCRIRSILKSISAVLLWIPSFSCLPDGVSSGELTRAYAQNLPSVMDTLHVKKMQNPDGYDGDPHSPQSFLENGRESALICASKVAKQYGAIVHVIVPNVHISVGVADIPHDQNPG